ncbi:MAG TPA: hypothetical protein VMM77_05475 [Gemmatimonadaceae bacterium]|nr:hypothetical protein [Gemmatimonadaceae bacterium]
MINTRYMRFGFLALLSTSIVACADSPLTAPEEIAAPSALISASKKQVVYASDSDPRLLRWFDLELRRVAAAEISSKPEYQQLKRDWKRMNRKHGHRVSRLIYCEPLQYAAAVQIVGPNGGEVEFGPHKLSIPPRALNGYTVVTAEAPVSEAVEATFSPHGLAFERQALLSLSYAHCNRPASSQESIVYVLNGEIVDWLPSADRDEDATVDAWIDHFSGYHVAF